VRALLYERDQTTRQWFAGVLRARGHAVEACAEVEQAWQAAEAQPFPLLVLDWSGPDGSSLCRRLRAASDGWRPVALATGLMDRTDELSQAIAAGADDYVAKPADAGMLEARLLVAEAQVRQREARARAELLARQFRKALDVLAVGVTITDLECRIVYANRACAELHGFEPDELMGRDARLLSPRGAARSLTQERLREARRWRRERTARRKDGSTFPALLVSDVVPGPDGAPAGLVTVCEDLSERGPSEPPGRRRAADARGLGGHA
jgi:PAS domain S-box-containing protein